MAEGVSFRSSAFSAPGNKNALDVKNEHQKTSSTHSSLRSTDTESIIPELTRAEELAIKRASSSFAPVPQTETQDQGHDNEPRNNPFSWQPSRDLMMSIEGTTGPKDTRNWDDGIELTQQGPQVRLQIIQDHVRGSTPDSVASSGKLRINRGDGAYKDVDKTRLPSGAEGAQERRLNLAKSTRDMVKFGQFDRLDDLDDGATMNGNIEMRSRQVTPDVTEIQPTRHKKTYFLPKVVVVLLFVMALIAGIVALIVKIDKPAAGNRGQVVSNPIQYAECEDQSFQLGDSFKFSCKIATEHEYRKDDLKNAHFVRIIKHNTVSEPYVIDWSINSTKVNYSTGKNVTCSSEGIYNLEFLNKTNDKINIRRPISLKITIKPSHMNVTFKQKMVDKCNKPDTYFDATCQRSNDCHSYQPLFFRRIYGSEDSLNHLMNCSYTYTDTAGYTTNCSARFPETLLENDVFLGCRMTSQTDRSRDREEVFKLPLCQPHSSCKTRTRDVPYSEFNCTAKSIHLQELDKGNCSFPYLENCFRDRPIFRYFKNEFEDITCNESNNTIPVCRLAWCRDYNYIVKKEIPGIAICGGSYVEPSV